MPMKDFFDWTTSPSGMMAEVYVHGVKKVRIEARLSGEGSTLAVELTLQVVG